MNENMTELLPGLYGSFIDKSRVVGMCKYHKTAMTVKTMKQHGCLCKHGKQCDAFEKCAEHDFWRQHEQKKERRKAKKQMIAGIVI